MSHSAILVQDHALGHKEYFKSLTGLRGFAAAWVFLYHAWVFSEPRLMTLNLAGHPIDLTPLFSCGWAGVDFFFVLSAFLLSLPFAHWACGERAFPNAGKYLARRFRRIFPAYWAQLAVLLVLASSTALFVFPGTKALIVHLFMFLNLPPFWVAPLNQVWWTLPTEFIFYLLLLPMALLLKHLWTRWVLFGLMAGAWLYRWLIFQAFQDRSIPELVVLLYNTIGCLDQFIIGTFCAYFYVRHLKKPAVGLPPGLFFALGITGLLLCLYSMHWLFEFYWEGHLLLFLKNTFTGICIASILVAILKGSRLPNGLFGNRIVVHCGIISYSIYLWHYPILVMLSRWSFIEDYEGYKLPLVLLISVPVTWAVAYSSYRWIERPFIAKGSPANR